MEKILRLKLFTVLIKLKAPVRTADSPLDSNGFALEPVSFEPAPLEKLYNAQNQIRLFNDAKQKGEALYYAHWAK